MTAIWASNLSGEQAWGEIRAVYGDEPLFVIPESLFRALWNEVSPEGTRRLAAEYGDGRALHFLMVADIPMENDRPE